jgi:addiction module HigA family antidote
MKPLRMHHPPHPGEILRELCLAPLKLSVTDAAASLDVSRNTLSAILNGRAGISPEMAVRLSIAFDTTAESWLFGMRSNHGSVCGSGDWPPRSASYCESRRPGMGTQ